MKKTLLPITEQQYRNRIFVRAIFCVAVFALTVSLNLVLVFSRTEQNHKAHLIMNIASDIVAFSFLLAYISVKLLPMLRLVRLADSNSTSTASGVVISLGERETVENFECIPVQLDSGRKAFLVCDGDITLSLGDAVRISMAGYFITEVEYD